MMRGLLVFALLISPAAAQDALQIQPETGDTIVAFRVMEDGALPCTLYQEIMGRAPVIDWSCAEKTAAKDGGDAYAKLLARALVAVRDHSYEEKH